MKSDQLYPAPTRELNQQKASLVPETMEAWRTFSQAVFKDGALPAKTKQLIAVAVAHVTQCPYCIRAHTAQAFRKGASRQEIMEAIWVASEMRAGAGYEHASIAMDELNHLDNASQPSQVV